MAPFIGPFSGSLTVSLGPVSGPCPLPCSIHSGEARTGKAGRFVIAVRPDLLFVHHRSVSFHAHTVAETGRVLPGRNRAESVFLVPLIPGVKACSLWGIERLLAVVGYALDSGLYP